MAIKREYGAECPYIPAGPFKIRIPFVHYRFEIADYVQGLIMCAVCLSAIPMLQDYMGMPLEVALAVVVLNGTLYCLHVLLGDPVIPGWVTPAIPLLFLYVSGYPLGPERIRALIAFEMTLGIVAIVLGITGLGKRIVDFVPDCMQSGLLMGSGFAAVNVIFQKGLRFDKFPLTISICIGIAFFLIYSNIFKKWQKENKAAKLIGNLGLLPCIVLACILGPIFGESKVPVINWGITHPDFAQLWNEWTFWGTHGGVPIGFPTFDLFIKGFPTVISAYIILFGDMIQTQALLMDGQNYRPDEKIDYNPNRSHLVFGGRNLLMSVISPDITMCGPLWAAMQVVVCERYKKGRDAMDSINGGSGSFRFGTLTGYFIGPIVSVMQPILDVAMASTMLIQGYVSVRVGVMKARTFNDLGIAGVMAAVLAARGAAWGLAVGIVLFFLIKVGDRSGEDYIFEDTAQEFGKHAAAH
jgi:hypothetical protein